MLLILLAAACTDVPTTPSLEPAVEPVTQPAVSLVELTEAAWSARTEAEQAAREAVNLAQMDTIMDGIANAEGAEEKQALLALTAEDALYKARKKVGSNPESGLKTVAKTTEQLSRYYPDSPHSFELTCSSWLALSLMEKHDEAAAHADTAVSLATTPAQRAVAHLLRAESHTAKGEADAAGQHYSDARAQSESPVPVLVRYRLQEDLSADLPQPAGEAPYWLTEVEAMLREGRIGR